MLSQLDRIKTLLALRSGVTISVSSTLVTDVELPEKTISRDLSSVNGDATCMVFQFATVAKMTEVSSLKFISLNHIFA